MWVFAMSEHSTHGTLQAAIIDIGDEMPCSADDVVTTEKFESKSLVVWYVDTGSDRE